MAVFDYFVDYSQIISGPNTFDAIVKYLAGSGWVKDTEIIYTSKPTYDYLINYCQQIFTYDIFIDYQQPVQPKAFDYVIKYRNLKWGM